MRYNKLTNTGKGLLNKLYVRALRVRTNRFYTEMLVEQKKTIFYLRLVLLINVLLCFFLTLFIQYKVRINYNTFIIGVLPSFLTAIGTTCLFSFVRPFGNIFAIFFTSLIVNIFHEFLRYIDNGIKVDIYDLIIAFFGVSLTTFLYSYLRNKLYNSKL
jgi:hypothetical protein